jgi:predicted regulator of amino acid metabolism with ACT domain
MQNESRRGVNPAAFLIVILLMALTSLVTFYFVKSNETTKREDAIESKNEEISSLTEKMEALAKDLDAKIKESKKLGVDYKTLLEYKNQIEQDLATLQKSADISSTQARQYLAKIQGYEQVIVAKDKELADLREQNKALGEERDFLSSTKDSLESETESLSSTVSEVKQNNQKLTNVAATLKAEAISILAYNNRDKAESRNVFRARRIEKLSIDFVIAENQITESGSKNIYMRLVEPAGTVVFNSNQGGKTEANGQDITYTMRKQIAYSNTRQPVNIIFEKQGDYDFNEGKYKIELYADGKLIGFQSFVVN